MRTPITEGPIYRHLLYFFFPIMLGTFFQQLYNTADAIIVGNVVGKEALAAVGGPTSSLINFLVNLFVGLSSGATVVAAQHFGSRDYADVHRTVHTGMAISLAAGAVITVAGIVLAAPMLRAMDTPADVLPHAVSYLQVYFLGTIPSFVYNMGASVLRAVGDTKRPLYFLIAACLTNIAMDLVFVAALGLGTVGAAIATILSQVVSAALILLALRHDSTFALNWKAIRFDGPILRKIVRIGLPAGLQSDMYALSNILIQASINSFGTDTTAAWTAFGKMDSFYWLGSAAFGVAITTFVGQNFGAGKYRRVRRSLWVCMGLTLAFTVLMSLVYCLGAPVLLRVFNGDSAVLEIGTHMVYAMAPWYFLFVAVEVLAGGIRGTGDSLIPMLITCGGVCVLRIVWIFAVLPMNRTLDTLMLGYPITWGVTSALFFLYYFQGSWLRRQIARGGMPPEER